MSGVVSEMGDALRKDAVRNLLEGARGADGASGVFGDASGVGAKTGAFGDAAAADAKAGASLPNVSRGDERGAVGASSRPLTIAILAAEPSGEMEGAWLARALWALDPHLHIVGAGGRQMLAAGVELMENTDDCSTIGIADAIRKFPILLGVYRRSRDRLLEIRPDLTVFIDSPAGNMRLAGVLQKHGLRTAYFFPPSAWTRSERRLREIHGRVNAVICAFERNARAYARFGLPVAYFGHPLVDICHAVPARAEARRQLQLNGLVLALMPGSRDEEVENLLPVFLQTAERLRLKFPGLTALIPCATSHLEKVVSRLVGPGREWVRMLSGSSSLALSACDAVLLCSGTASLEAAILGRPMVICYRFSWINRVIGRLLLALGILKVDYVGLPNLVVKERVIPELIQENACVEQLVPLMSRLLQDTPRRRQMLADLGRVQRSLGEAGAVDKVAACVLALARGASIEDVLSGGGSGDVGCGGGGLSGGDVGGGGGVLSGGEVGSGGGAGVGSVTQGSRVSVGLGDLRRG